MARQSEQIDESSQTSQESLTEEGSARQAKRLMTAQISVRITDNFFMAMLISICLFDSYDRYDVRIRGAHAEEFP